MVKGSWYLRARGEGIGLHAAIMRLPSLLLASALLFGSAAGRAAAESSAPLSLFNGRDFAGWEWVVTPSAPIEQALRYGPDGVVILAGKPTSFLQTTATHRNYALHVEWRWPGATGNGGVLVHITSGPKDRQWPLSIQVQTKFGSVGDVLPMAGAAFREELDPKSKTPQRLHLATNSERPAGEWNEADIICRDGTIAVTINGVVQNGVTGSEPDRGHIGFQFEGVSYEVRNVRLTALP